jgi:hypothetical protein
MVKRLTAGAAILLGAMFVTSVTAITQGQPAGAFPAAADIESFRGTVEKVFMTDRGGTTPGFAACVMCHTWQTKVRFTLETPATDAGWTVEQSRKNFDVVTRLINTAAPATSRLLLKPLDPAAGGMGHTGGTYWKSIDERIRLHRGAEFSDITASRASSRSQDRAHPEEHPDALSSRTSKACTVPAGSPRYCSRSGTPLPTITRFL